MAFQHRARRDGARTREITLYADPARTSVDAIVANTRKAITDRTRVFAATWVHSCTGVKLPLRAMADAVEKLPRYADVTGGLDLTRRWLELLEQGG